MSVSGSALEAERCRRGAHFVTWLAAKARSLADSSCSFWSSCRLVLASYTLAISSLIWRAAVRAASLVLRAVLHSQRCISLHCQQV